jgi:hypothetical protein
VIRLYIDQTGDFDNGRSVECIQLASR